MINAKPEKILVWIPGKRLPKNGVIKETNSLSPI
jgi:hypothetical protein